MDDGLFLLEHLKEEEMETTDCTVETVKTEQFKIDDHVKILCEEIWQYGRKISSEGNYKDLVQIDIESADFVEKIIINLKQNLDEIRSLIAEHHLQQCQENGQNSRSHGAPSEEIEEEIEEGVKGKEKKNRSRINQKIQAKALRNAGKEYVSPTTSKTMSARKVGSRCSGELCAKIGRKCIMFSEADRLNIFSSFNDIGDLQSQREFIAYHIESVETKQKTTKEKPSRRHQSIRYHLTLDDRRVLVCKKFFLNTLGISERMCRTVMSKTNEIGLVDRDRRGGRQRPQSVIDKEKKTRMAIDNHIEKFPKIQGQHCQHNMTDYLHPDLTLKKMYSMFLVEWSVSNEDKPSFQTYRRVFKMKNLSFYPPKFDLCTECMTSEQG